MTSDLTSAAPMQAVRFFADRMRGRSLTEKNAMTASRKIGYARVRRYVRDGMATGQWHLVIPASVTGTGKQVRKLFDSRKEAEAEARAISRQYQARLLGLAQPQRQVAMTFAELADSWVDWEGQRVRTLRKKPGSHTTDLARLRYLREFFARDDISTITTERVADYEEWRIGQNTHSKETINGELRTLRKIMRWGAKKEYVARLPEFEITGAASREVDIPTPVQMVRLLEALPSRLRPVIRFMAETGCRSGEAFHLTWDCVDELRGVVQFKPHDGWTPKTKQSVRRVFINPQLLEIVRHLPKSGRYVFAGRVPDSPITSVKKALATAVRRAGLTVHGRPMKITPHVLRKAHATWLAMGGVPQRVLQTRLGHAAGSTITDRYYVQAMEDAERSAAFCLPATPQPENPVAKTGNESEGKRGAIQRVAT